MSRQISILHCHFKSINHRVSEWVRAFADRDDVDQVNVFYCYVSDVYCSSKPVVPYDFGISNHPKVKWIEVKPRALSTSLSWSDQVFAFITKVFRYSVNSLNVRIYFIDRQQNIPNSLFSLLVFPLFALCGLILRYFPIGIQEWEVLALIKRTGFAFDRAFNDGQIRLSDRDILLATNLWTLASGARMKTLSACKLWYDPMEVTFDMFWTKNALKNICSRAIWKLYETQYVRSADLVATVSEPMKRLYERTYEKMGIGQILVTPNAFYFHDYNVVPTASEAVKFVIQMNYSPERGLMEFIEAFRAADCKNSTLTLRIPHAPPDLMKRIGAIKNIVVAPPIQDENHLTSSLVGFDVGIIPYLPDTSHNHRVCCPNKFFQYMNAGLAVLSTATEFLGDSIAANHVGWTYNPYDVPSAAAVISRICRDAEGRRQASVNAINFVKNQFNSSRWQHEISRALGASAGLMVNQSVGLEDSIK